MVQPRPWRAVDADLFRFRRAERAAGRAARDDLWGVVVGRAGIGITTWLADRAGTTPWRMDAADYEAACAGAAVGAAEGEVPATPRDPALREAMQRHRLAVYEESLADSLLQTAS